MITIPCPKIHINCSSVITEIRQNQIDLWRKIFLQFAICQYPLVVRGGVGFKCVAKEHNKLTLVRAQKLNHSIQCTFH